VGEIVDDLLDHSLIEVEGEVDGVEMNSIDIWN
jgi:hypothetical protein